MDDPRTLLRNEVKEIDCKDIKINDGSDPSGFDACMKMTFSQTKNILYSGLSIFKDGSKFIPKISLGKVEYNTIHFKNFDHNKIIFLV